MPIVQAVGVAVAHGRTGEAGERAKAVHDAMVAALREAQARGITDPDELRRVQLEARDNLNSSAFCDPE